MTGHPPQRPVQPLAVTGTPTPARHETVIPGEPADAVTALRAAVAVEDSAEQRAALASVAARHPAFLEAWARLSEASLAGGDPVTAYACARVAYHRGLDRLRRVGWGGTGIVRWAEPGNRGFLRGLRALLAAAAALDEEDEAVRCRSFLLDLDPEDGIGAAVYPETPGPGWTPPPLA